MSGLCAPGAAVRLPSGSGQKCRQPGGQYLAPQWRVSSPAFSSFASWRRHWRQSTFVRSRARRIRRLALLGFLTLRLHNVRRCLTTHRPDGDCSTAPAWTTVASGPSTASYMRRGADSSVATINNLVVHQHGGSAVRVVFLGLARPWPRVRTQLHVDPSSFLAIQPPAGGG